MEEDIAMKKIYPDLPLNPDLPIRQDLPPLSDNPQTFRLQQISIIKKFFEDEIEFRRKIFSKYSKSFDIITGVTHFLTAAEIVTGSVSITTLAGVIAAPIGIGLGGITIASAVVSFSLNFGKKKILAKLSKHEKIYTLAISKLNTINDLVSRALTDSFISPDEFTLILKEKEKYTALKNTIRKEQRQAASNDKIDVETLKKTFLEEGKKMAQTEMIEKLKQQ